MPPTSTPDLPDWDSVLTVRPDQPITVPIAVWICIALGAYIVVIVLILMIRQCVLAKGWCGECQVDCCDGSCSRWCLDACKTSCDCRSPSITGCLDSICPQRRNINFADVVTCACCAEQCGCCEDGCDCGDCNCIPNCDTDNCTCCGFECQRADQR